jgi:hypothetical protein
MCASYHPGLNLLAIALIDKEIKIYKLKQNGSKVVFTDLFSFHIKHPANFTVTCLHIEQYVVNSRPILCVGSTQGDIAVFYLDEPVIINPAVIGGPSKGKNA